MATEIEILMEKIAALKSANTPAPPVTQDLVTLSKSDLEVLIAEAVRKATTPKEVTLEEALALLFTEEERTYLASPTVIKKLPNFITSEVGKPLTINLFNELRKYNELS